MIYILLLAALFATLNAIVCGYYLVQANGAERGSDLFRGSIYFASISGTTALLLFTIAALKL